MRVVSIGKPVEELLADPGAEDNFQYSIEFCGGTHLGNTSGVRSTRVAYCCATDSRNKQTCSASSPVAAPSSLVAARGNTLATAATPNLHSIP